jgi:hypothetical protein
MRRSLIDYAKYIQLIPDDKLGRPSILKDEPGSILSRTVYEDQSDIDEMVGMDVLRYQTERATF